MSTACNLNIDDQAFNPQTKVERLFKWRIGLLTRHFSAVFSCHQ